MKGILKCQSMRQIAAKDSQYNLSTIKENTRINTDIRSLESKGKRSAKCKSEKRVRFQGETFPTIRKEPMRKDVDCKPAVSESISNTSSDSVPSRPDMAGQVLTMSSPKAKVFGIFDIPQCFCGPEIDFMTTIKSRKSDKKRDVDKLPFSVLSSLVTEWQEASNDIFMSLTPSWINQTASTANKAPTPADTAKSVWT
jgi:hypothetical protein